MLLDSLHFRATSGSSFSSLTCQSHTGGTIRIRGKNLTENEHVKLGAYHTLELEQQRAFTLFKSSWDALDVDRVKQATDPALSADLAAILITVRDPGASYNVTS